MLIEVFYTVSSTMSLYILVSEVKKSMGILGRIIILFLLAIILMIAGLVKNSKLMKAVSITVFVISFAMLLFVWNALGYM